MYLFAGGPVLVAWEHAHIYLLAEALGAKKSDIPKKVRHWDGKDFDTTLTLKFKKHGSVDLTHGSENFRPSSYVV